jgi:hypothetical protein
MTIYVQMDNPAAIEHYREHADSEDIRVRPLAGERIFEISFPEDEENPVTLREMVMTTMATFRYHQEAGNASPAKPVALVPPKWVRASDPRLQAELVAEYKITKNDIPAGFGSEHGSWDQVAMPSLRTINHTAGLLTVSLYLLAAWSLFRLTRLQLRTTTGRDWQANIMGNPANNGTGAYAAAAWIGVTADATLPTLADTVLPGEITTGTLIRAQGAFGHTTGAASYTVSKLFVSDQSITIPKIGIFNLATGGSPFIETMLSAAAVLNSGDQLQIVSTVTL